MLPLEGLADNTQAAAADNMKDTALGSGHSSDPVPPLQLQYQLLFVPKRCSIKTAA